MRGYVFDIKHFAVHDGPGIRTTVFLKGCPLKCVWCHNPESISTQTQLGFIQHKCTNCGRCVAVCPTGAQYMDNDGVHRFDRSKCITCGKCSQACYGKVLTLYGRYADSDEIFAELMEDVDFYESSNGGVTLSGGECLLQAEFCAELLEKLHSRGIHTAVDTCGAVSKKALEMVIPYTDLFLYDMKAFDEDVHKKCTGVSNKLILENLRFLNEAGKNIEIRIPCVPDWNMDQLEKIGKFLCEFDHIVGVRLLPYHNFAGTKYTSLDMINTLPENLPTDKEMALATDTLETFGLKILH